MFPSVSNCALGELHHRPRCFEAVDVESSLGKNHEHSPRAGRKLKHRTAILPCGLDEEPEFAAAFLGRSEIVIKIPVRCFRGRSAVGGTNRPRVPHRESARRVPYTERFPDLLSSRALQVRRPRLLAIRRRGRSPSSAYRRARDPIDTVTHDDDTRKNLSCVGRECNHGSW